MREAKEHLAKDISEASQLETKGASQLEDEPEETKGAE